MVAAASSVVATILGTAVALLFVRFRFRGRWLLLGLAMLPLIVPFVVLGGAMLVLFRVLDVDRSLLTVGIAHVVVGLPFVVIIVLARLIGFDPQIEEAAMDLGATYPGTLRLVVLPIIAPAMVAAGLTAFTVSFDEFALALFLAGKDPTFPGLPLRSAPVHDHASDHDRDGHPAAGGNVILLVIAERVRRVR